MTRLKVFALASLCAVPPLSFTGAQAATTILTENTFAPGSVETVQVLNSGAAHSATPGFGALSVTTLGNGIGLTTHFFSPLNFTPSSFPITSIDVAFDFTPQSAYGQGHGIGVALRQNGSIFLSSVNGGITGSVNGTTVSTGNTNLQASDWTYLSGTVTAVDYSGGAGLMELGLYNGNDRGQNITVVYDNFEITINDTSPIPLPAGLPLLAAGLGVLMCIRRTRSQA